jgi:hypothetical protein
MSQHLVCLTIDTDPDGLSANTGVNRNTLIFRGLEEIQALPEKLEAATGSNIPFTWFVRMDGQLEHAFGSALYLFEKYASFWQQARLKGHEFGWHPHLYHVSDDNEVSLISEPGKACEELGRLWGIIHKEHPDIRSFRNGEGWHTTETLNYIEQLGIINDCTAIPGRALADHPMNWIGTANHPFYPDKDNHKLSGSKRKLLEIPINTWMTRASYDKGPKLRYINPCVYEDIFENALDMLAEEILSSKEQLFVWTLICHPDDILFAGKPDLLYALSMDVYVRNVERFCKRISEIGHNFEFATISDAADKWRNKN